MKKHIHPIDIGMVSENPHHGLNLDWREYSTAMAIMRGIQHKREREAVAKRAMLVLPGIKLPQRK